MDERCFAAGSDLTEINQTLSSLLSECGLCLGKKSYFCLQKSCKTCSPFCLRCQSYMHTLHRINEVKYVFVDHAKVKPTHHQAISYLEDLISMMTYQKTKAEVAVVESIKIAEDLKVLVADLEAKLRELLRNNPLDEIYKLVEGTVMANRQYMAELEETFPEVRYEVDSTRADKRLKFDKLFTAIDFTQEYKFQQSQSFMKMIKKLQIYHQQVMSHTDGHYPYSFVAQDCQPLQLYLTMRRRHFSNDLFSLLRQTHLHQFVGSSWRGIIPIDPHYRRSVKFSKYSRRNNIGRRLYTDDYSNHEDEEDWRESLKTDCQTNWEEFNDLLKDSSNINELCVYQNNKIKYFPKNLRSLSCSIDKFSLVKVPTSVRMLRVLTSDIRRTMGIRRRNIFPNPFAYNGHMDVGEIYIDQEVKDSYSLSHLNNLKYLVVLDANIAPQEVKRLIRLAIKGEFRMLAILTSFRRIAKQIRLEDFGEHKIPELEAIYKVYRRRMLQATVLSRTRFIGKTCFKQGVMDAICPGFVKRETDIRIRIIREDGHEGSSADEHEDGIVNQDRWSSSSEDSEER